MQDLDSIFSVKKSRKNEDGERVAFWEHLPFNPLLYGWEFKEACCCNVKFTKGDNLLGVTDKGITYVKNGDKTVAFNTPENQLQFLILEHGINTETFVSAAESIKATDSHGHD